MIVLDAYAIIAILVDEPASDEVADLLGRGDCAVSTVNLIEAADVLARSGRVEIARTRDAVGSLAGSSLVVVDVDERCAWRAAEIRARHYRRRESEVSLADCVLLATAVPGRDSVATPDLPVINAARAEGLDVIALSDSTGRTPR